MLFLKHTEEASRCIILGALFFFSLASFAHENHQQGAPHQAASKAEAHQAMEAISIIRTSYEAKILPIFKRSCFDCHSQSTIYPWYSSLPFVRSLIKHDTEEAREHLDFSAGFPFKGHGSPRSDLEAIRDEIRKSSMPPLRYLLLHWKAGLSMEEKRAISDWATNSINLLPAEPAATSKNKH